VGTARTYLGRVIWDHPAARSDHRHGVGECPTCGRLVDLDRSGRYRRHYALDPQGRRRLCPASGRREETTVRLLTVEPTPEERYSHALALLRSLEL
jgi:hypothetical protein